MLYRANFPSFCNLFPALLLSAALLFLGACGSSSSSGGGGGNGGSTDLAFSEGATATRTLAENTAADVDIGAAFAVANASGSVTYALSGTDVASFQLSSSTPNQLQTKSGATYDFETKPSYSVTITATDDNSTPTTADDITATITVTINLTDVASTLAFSPTTATRMLDENTAADTAIGAALAQATDSTDTTPPAITYALGGDDAADFAFDATSRQLSTPASATTYDYEDAANRTRSVTITATGAGAGAPTAVLTVTIAIENVMEPPSAPMNIRVAPGDERLTIRWDPLVEAGKTAVTGYTLQVRDASDSDAGTCPTPAALDAGDPSSRISSMCTGLTNGDAYTVQVMAQNAEGSGPLSTAVTVTPMAPLTAMLSLPKLSAGDEHTCASWEGGNMDSNDDNETAWCWGTNDDDQLGLGTVAENSANDDCRNIGGLCSASPRKVVDGGGNLTGVLAIAAGGTSNRYFSCAVVDGGAGNDGVRCWGDGEAGQLGDGNAADSNVPVAVTGIGGAETGATQVAAGYDHSCALLSDGGVHCWGVNASGQLGLGSSPSPALSTCVVGIGLMRSCSLTPRAVVGEEGTGTLSGVVDIGAGEDFSCALLSTGGVRCWGAGAGGRLGNGSSSGTEQQPVVVRMATEGGSSALAGALRLSVGFRSMSCVVQDNATPSDPADDGAKCWGFGATTATDVVGTDGTGRLQNVAAVSAGERHACAPLHTGAALCWGEGNNGRLGDGQDPAGTFVDRDAPVYVCASSTATTPCEDEADQLSGVTALSAGSSHTCAIQGSGTNAVVKCWGTQGNGRLGNGETGSGNISAPPDAGISFTP